MAIFITVRGSGYNNMTFDTTRPHMKRNPLYRALITAVAVPVLMAGCAHYSTAGQAPAAPQQASTAQYPAAWPLYGLNAGHDAVFNSRMAMPDGPAWEIALPGAVPKGASKARIKQIYVSITAVRDLVGVPIGVSVVDGTVYVSDDNGYLYAVEAQTGRVGWGFDAKNQIMTTPIVAGTGAAKLVYVGGGNSDFSYTEAAKFAHPGQMVVRGTDISGIYALNAKDGTPVWRYQTKGEDMPTPAYIHGRIVFGNGDGHIYGLDAASGKLLWKIKINSFVSMASATRYKNLIVMAGTHPNGVYAVNADTGRLAWHTQPPRVFSSSLGDCAPAQSDGVVVTQYEEQAPGMRQARSVELGLDAQTGRILWHTVLGQGRVPPRNKDAVPLIANGVVYTGSPVTATTYAVALHSGKVLWRTPLKVKMKAAPSVLGPYAFYPTGSGKIFTLDRKTGRIVHVYKTGHGGFGPQNAVIVNNAMIIGSNFGWLYSIPVSRLMSAQ